MTARLPVPGGDDGDWGDILNNYLSQSLNSDGSLKPIPSTSMDSAVQTSLGKADTAVQTVNGKSGTSVTLTATDVGAPTTLAADSDVNVAGVSNNQVLTYSTGTSKWIPATVTSTTISDATSSSKGIIQLAGDLGGNAAGPTVTQINGITLPGSAPSTGQVLTATGPSATNWGTPVSGAQALAATAVKTSAYSAAAGDFVPVDASGGSVTITLPAGPTDKTRIGVKMIAVSGSNTTTIARGGSTDVFNKTGGSTSLTLTLLNQGVLLQYTASTGIWYVQSDDLALSQLDSRYISTSGSSTPTATGQVAVAATPGSNILNWQTKLIFDPRDYDAKFDGSTDDRTAMSNCIAAAAAAITATGIGAVVQMPAGVTTWTSVCPNPPTNPSTGNPYSSKIGIGLPVNLAALLTIRGQGKGATTIRLTSNCHNAFWINKQADFDTFKNVTFEDFDIDNNSTTGRCHILIGTIPEYITPQTNLSINAIHIKRMSIYGVPFDSTLSTTNKAAIFFKGARTSNDPTHSGTQTSTVDVLCEDMAITDSQHGLIVCNDVGTIPYHYYDQIVFRRVRHVISTGVPANTLPETSFYICGSGYGDSCTIEDCYSQNIGDDSIEIGAMQTINIVRFQSQDPFLEAILFRLTQPLQNPNGQVISIRDSSVRLTGASVGTTGFSGLPVAWTSDAATGTATTSNGSTSLTSVSTSTGIFTLGQIISGTGIPVQTTITGISGSTITMSQAATAGASGVAIATTQTFGSLVADNFNVILDGVTASAINRTANSKALGFYLNGPTRQIIMRNCGLYMRNFVYDPAGTNDLAAIVTNLNPPGIGPAGQSPAICQIKDFSFVVEGGTSPGSGTLFLHGLWAGGQGDLEVDGFNAELALCPYSNKTLAEIGRAGSLNLIRLLRLRGLKFALSGSGAGSGIVLNSGGAFTKLEIDDCDFTQWTTGSGIDLSFTNAPANPGALLTIGRRNRWSNISASTLGGHVTVSGNTTLTPVVSSVGVTSTSSAHTMTLPTAANTPIGPENLITIADESNGAGTNNITVTCAGSDTYTDGTTAKIISTNGGGVQLYSTGSAWEVVSQSLAGGMLASTYDPAGINQQVVGTIATQTVSSKRITRRVVNVTQSATPAINTDNADVASITGLAQAITSMTTNLTGTPNDGDLLLVRITDNGTGFAITWGSSFESSTVALPTATVASTMLVVGFAWDVATSKWRCIAVA